MSGKPMVRGIVRDMPPFVVNQFDLIYQNGKQGPMRHEGKVEWLLIAIPAGIIICAALSIWLLMF